MTLAHSHLHHPWVVAALSLILSLGTTLPTTADEVAVVAATADCQQRVCRFSVTLRHADNGWQHYADRWQVLTADGEVLGTRMLLHPHDHEQPFTRSLGGVEIPDGVDEVTIGARDSVHGETGQRLTVQIP